MDYISREDAIKHLKNKIERNRADRHGHQGEFSPWVIYGIQFAIDIINGMPSADVEEVIRCKECVHWNAETKGCARNPSVQPWWENDFCKYGGEDGGGA